MNDTCPVVDDDCTVVDGALPFPSLVYSFMIRDYEPDQYIHAVTPSGDVVRWMEVKSHQFKPLFCVAYVGHGLYQSSCTQRGINLYSERREPEVLEGG